MGTNGNHRPAKQDAREANGRWAKGSLPAGAAPIFEHGKSGNPNGRPNAGAAVKDWFNQMNGWSLAALTKVAENPDSPVSKIAAANQWIRAMARGDELDRILDRTAGKPKQDIDVHGQMSHQHDMRPAVNALLEDAQARAAAMTLADRLPEVMPSEN